MIRELVPWKATGPLDLTLLTARDRRLTKLITPDGEEPYHDAALFYVQARRVDTIEDLAELLATLAALWSTCVIRAALKAPVHPDVEVRCWIHDRDGVPARFAEVARAWLMVDIEPAEAPGYIDPVDPLLTGGWLRRQLPPQFRHARCVCQLSSGAGRKPGLRAHLWFLLDRALTWAELDRLLGDVPGLDEATLRPRQLHYTANALFKDVDDPVYERIALLPGLAEVEVGAIPAPARRRLTRPGPACTPAVPRPHIPLLPRGLYLGSSRPAAYMRECLQAIMAAAPGRRHRTIVCVARDLYGLARAGSLDPRDIERRIIAAVNRSSFDRDIAEVYDALRWGWTHSKAWRLR